jgi:hypothetical protein
MLHEKLTIWTCLVTQSVLLRQDFDSKIIIPMMATVLMKHNNAKKKHKFYDILNPSALAISHTGDNDDV